MDGPLLHKPIFGNLESEITKPCDVTSRNIGLNFYLDPIRMI